MAYNLQIGNNWLFKHDNWLKKENRRSRRAYEALLSNMRNSCNMYYYDQKIGCISPSLCFQADVFYPNVLASVSRVTCEEGRLVLGCRGHQVQRDFPLESRLPVALPLVQYPTKTSERFLSELDLCAKPVLNWEKHVRFIYSQLRGQVSKAANSSNLSTKAEKLHLRNEKHKLIWKKKRWERKYEHLVEEERPPIEDMSTNSSSSESESESSSDEDNGNLPDVDLTISNTRRLKKKKKTFKELQSKVFRNQVNLELTPAERKRQQEEEELELQIQGKKIKPKQKKFSIKLGFYSIKPHNKQKKGSIPQLSLQKFKHPPDLRVEGTWNYFYGGASGALCCIHTKDKSNKGEGLDLFVGNRTQLRKVSLKPSRPASMLSYKVEGVWEEELSNVPVHSSTSLRSVGDGPTKFLHDVVFQIVPLEKFNIVGVRRGKSIDIYSTERQHPYLLDSIAYNISYGKPTSRKKSTGNNIIDPLVMGLDFNPDYGPEFITIDENLQVRIWDFAKHVSVSKYSLSKINRLNSYLPDYPSFRRLNDAAGISFGSNGQLFLAWGDCKVVLGDRRDNDHARNSLIDIFDLRRSASSISWSDQSFFNDVKPELNEYISAVKKSEKEHCYYVGTTSRILLMDSRVPGQPVLKLEHGMRSAAAYLDTYTNDTFETLVASSQRIPTTVCAITDQVHISCFNRPKCEARNPILYSLPRNLSNSREFFDTAFAEGYGPKWEDDHQRAKSHNNAWTTGLSVFKAPKSTNPREPPGILAFTSNCYGDVFCQEWGQKPIELHRKTDSQDTKFTSFLQQWKDSMTSKTMTEFQKPTLNNFLPVDCSLMIEPCASEILNMTNVRQKPFDPFTPNELHHQYVQETQRPFKETIKKLRTYNTERATRVLDYWEHNSDEEENPENTTTVEIKEERLENEMRDKYGSDNDDIEFFN